MPAEAASHKRWLIVGAAVVVLGVGAYLILGSGQRPELRSEAVVDPDRVHDRFERAPTAPRATRRPRRGGRRSDDRRRARRRAHDRAKDKGPPPAMGRIEEEIE